MQQRKSKLLAVVKLKQYITAKLWQTQTEYNLFDITLHKRP